MGGKDYRSANAAAMAAGGGKPVDAWRYRRLEDGRLLDALRDEPASPRPTRTRKVKGKGAGKQNSRIVRRLAPSATAGAIGSNQRAIPPWIGL